jgi:hypothetical protein
VTPAFEIELSLSTAAAEAKAQAFGKNLNQILSGGSAAGMNALNGTLGQLPNTMGAAGNAAGKLGSSLGAANNNGAALHGTFGKLREGAADALKEVLNLSKGFAGLGGLALAGGIAAIGVAVVGIGEKMFEATKEVEAYKASLTTIVGDANKAGQAFDALAAFAQKTPFTLDQAINGFIKLKALGLKPTEEAMTSYGNTSAAMGKSLEQMVEAVADASTGEFERLKEFGIKSKQQGDSVSFTFQGVTTKLGKNSKEIQDYLIGIGNTKFAGGMERQAKTLGGALSGLEDQIFLTFAKMGQGGFGTAMTDIINSITNGLQRVGPLLGSVGSVLGGIVNIAGNVASGIVSLFGAFTGEGSKGLNFLDALTVEFNIVGQAVNVVGSLIGSAFRGVANVVSWLVTQARSLFGSMFSWLTGFSASSIADVGLSFVGLLRSVKYVAGAIPDLFALAFEDVKKLFSGLGSIVGRLLTGDFSALGDIGKTFSTSFADSAKKMGDIVTKAKSIANDAKGAQASVDRMLGKGKTHSIDEFAGVDPKQSPAAPKADKTAEKRQNELEKYWRTLEQTVATSSLLPPEAEKLSKLQELQNIYATTKGKLDGKALEDARAKIGAALDEIATNKQLVSMRQDVGKIDNENLINSQKRLGLTETEAKVQDALSQRRTEALNAGAKLTDFASLAWQTEEKRLAAALKTKIAYDEQAAALSRVKDIAAKYSPDYDRTQRLTDIGKDRSAITASTLPADIKKSVLSGMDDAVRTINNEAREKFSQSITDLADQFSGKFGDAIKGLASALSGVTRAAGGDFSGLGAIGGIANLIGKDKDCNLNKVGDAVADSNKDMFKQAGDFFKTPATAMKNSLGSFKTDMKGLFDKGGSFQKSLGSLLGKAGAGAQIGGAVAGIGNALGLKMNGTGSQVGGALGSMALGPIGGIVGSIAGGLIGNLFSKPKYGTAGLSIVDGKLTGGSLTGNSKSATGAADSAMGSVISGLNSIASTLGATISGNPSVSIGTYKGNWRVSTTGYEGKLNYKNTANKGLNDFGKDGQEEAISFAIKAALQDNILSGITDFSKRLLSSAQDIDSAVSLASSYETLVKNLAALDNPLKSAIENITKPLSTMFDQMVKNGATSAELANVERSRKTQLDALLKDQLAGLNDLRSYLTGSGSGKTGLALFNDDLAKIANYKSDLDAGKSIDKQAFASLIQEANGLAGDVFGTSSANFAAYNADFLALTDKAIAGVTNEFNDLTSQTIQNVGDNLANALSINNDYQAQILEAIQSLASNDNANALNYNALNGSITGIY